MRLAPILTGFLAAMCRACAVLKSSRRVTVMLHGSEQVRSRATPFLRAFASFCAPRPAMVRTGPVVSGEVPEAITPGGNGIGGGGGCDAGGGVGVVGGGW